MIGNHIVSLFATPVVNLRWPDADRLCSALEQHILALEKSHTGIEKSNVGGWHSNMAFLQSDEPAVTELKAGIEQRILELNAGIFDGDSGHTGSQFRLDGWANVLRHGGYNSLHSHPNAFWSGVFYVNDNDAVDKRPFSGKLELIDPRPEASVTYAEHTRLYGRFLLNPVAGQMIVFPAWLKHQVHPYFGDRARISVAFNVVLEDV